MKEVYLVCVLYLLAAARLTITLLRHRLGYWWKKMAREYLDSFLVAGMAAIVLITFVVRSFYIPSESMVPTLLVNDYILVNRFVYNFASPSRGRSSSSTRPTSPTKRARTLLKG